MLDTVSEEQRQQLDRVGYLFGHPINHSMSPLLHQVIYKDLNLRWAQLPLDSTDMNLFLGLMKDPKFYGASVTMPHKVAIIPHLDEITPEGREVGACNTIFVRERNGKRIYCGTNTDVVGIRDAFYQNVENPDAVFHGRPAMVLGGGGAARSAVYALHKWMQASKIYLVNRDKSEVDAVIEECATKGYGDKLVHISTVEEAERLEGPGAVVACVPNFSPKTEQEKVARSITEVLLKKQHKGAMLEMCYHPTPWTELASIAEENGWKLILGTDALIWQGLEQDKYWTGKDVTTLPVQKVHDAIAAKLLESQPKL